MSSLYPLTRVIFVKFISIDQFRVCQTYTHRCGPYLSSLYPLTRAIFFKFIPIDRGHINQSQIFLHVSNFIKYKGISSVGTMGLGPAPLANRPSPRAPKELGPRASRSRNARPVLCPGARVSHIQMPFYSSVSFLDRQLHQMKLPTGSSWYKYKVSHEPVC